MAKQTRLYEITIIRPIIIVLLVFMHSFTMFTGGATWPLPNGIYPVKLYEDLTWFSYGFLMEAFVFISGYLFSYQLKSKQMSLISIVKKKSHRLLLPSIVFSVIYFLFFLRDDSSTLLSSMLNILSGSGHLWFLPMLFWCFIFGYIIKKSKIPERIKHTFCLICAMVSGIFGFLPFQLSKACYYLFFFYLGMSIFNKKDALLAWLSRKKIVLLIISYIFCYVLLSAFKENLTLLTPSNLFYVFGRSVLLKSSTLIYSTLGLMSLFCVVLYWLNRHQDWKPSLIWVNANLLCFGVYIYHQFILKYLYYNTAFPSCFDTYSLPWVGFGSAIVVSILFTWITRRSRLGRFLLG